MDNTDLKSKDIIPTKYMMENFLTSDEYAFWPSACAKVGHKCTSNRFGPKMDWNEMKKLEKENYRENYHCTEFREYNSVSTSIYTDYTYEKNTIEKYFHDKDPEKYPDYTPVYETITVTAPRTDPRYQEESFKKWSWAKWALMYFTEDGYIAPRDVDSVPWDNQYSPWFTGHWAEY